jgi:hypothetical protein
MLLGLDGWMVGWLDVGRFVRAGSTVGKRYSQLLTLVMQRFDEAAASHLRPTVLAKLAAGDLRSVQHQLFDSA